MGPLIERDYKNAWPCSNESICDVDLICFKLVNSRINKHIDRTIKRMTHSISRVRSMCFLIPELTNPKQMRSISHIDSFEPGHAFCSHTQSRGL